MDRVAGTLTITDGGEPRILETTPQTEFGNRFAQHVFPALRAQLNGDASDHPDLGDGYDVQRFTDAAAASAREGRWVDVS